MRRPNGTLVQPDAAALLDRVIYPASCLAATLHVARVFVTHPVTTVSLLRDIVRSVWRHPLWLLKSLVAWWRALGVLAAVRRLAPDHIHAHYATYPSTIALVFAKYLNVPFSFTSHAHDIYLNAHLLEEKVARARFSVVVSEFGRRVLRERVRGGDDRIRLIHCGVSMPEFPYRPGEREAGRILAVGRLEKIKGFHVLIDACARLHAAGARFTCDIVGGGSEARDLQARIDACGLGGRVRLLGATPQEDVRRHLYHARVFALPSVPTPDGDMEGIPVALMEAMAAGTPVVSTALAGIPELVEDGVSGLLVAPGDASALADALRRLLDDEELSGRLAAQARRRVEDDFDAGKGARELYAAIGGSQAAAAELPDTPFVSVMIPVRNEVRFVEPLLRSVLTQEYPADRFEVIVADGLSTDGTRDRLAALQREFPQLVVIDNPARIVSTGLNAAIAIARGEVVVRIDGHALAAPDFIRRNVELLREHPEAWGVGGPIRHVASTAFGRAVAVAMSSAVGVGTAFHRYPDYEGYSDSTQFPAFRRWVFDRVGVFDPRLVRNQDDEFNYRITHAGGKLYVSPRVRYSYFVRERIGQLYRQYFQYGFWRIPVIQKHRRPTTVRQLAPSAFYALCLALAAIGAWLGQPWIAAALPMSYALALAAAGVVAWPRHGAAIAARLPVAIAVIHAGYALGMGYGLWARFFQPAVWDIQGQMAALSR